jgi:succinate-semialdehyde dehydrogenase / glutarate-semialdehyde dehydrogenase
VTTSPSAKRPSAASRASRPISTVALAEPWCELVLERAGELARALTLEGGKPGAGGRQHGGAQGGTVDGLDPERFFAPTVLSGVPADARIAREETFGPVAPLFRFRTDEEGVRMANATEFGLACYFYTRDLGRAFRVSEGLEYGQVGVNAGVITTEVAPFGGVKESGLGREGSKYGWDDYVNIKYVCVGGV